MVVSAKNPRKTARTFPSTLRFGDARMQGFPLVKSGQRADPALMHWRSHDLAPSPGQILCAVEEIPDGHCKEIRYGEDAYAFSVLVHRSGAVIKAYVNRCPHFSLPLNNRPGHFVMLDEARVMCAFHGAVFRLENGYCEAGPAASSFLEPVEVIVRDGAVCIAHGGTR